MSLKGGTILLLAAIVMFVAVSFFVRSGPGPGSRNYIPQHEQQAADAAAVTAQEPAVMTAPVEDSSAAPAVTMEAPAVMPPPADETVTTDMPMEAPSEAPTGEPMTTDIPGSALSGEGEAAPPMEGSESAAPPEQTGEAMPPAEPAPACDFAMWVGQPVNEETVKATGRPYRILPPGSMATMDYSAERINVHTDDAGVVTEVTCG